MKQEEKTKRTRQRIIAAALEEFGTKSYESASINVICSRSKISKGLLYYNFKSKDELYLQCVTICYDEMAGFLKAKNLELYDAEKSLQKILETRQQFYEENPYLSNIFFNSVLQPPKHLLLDIQKIRQEFDKFYTACYRNLLNHLTLRDGITEEMAMEYFSMFVEMFNGFFQRKVDQGNDYHAFIQDHEGALSDILKIMLYGIAQEKS